MGKCIGADGRGRYGKGGQQVASLFAESTDNEKIKAIYGNYSFWAWLRYWYLDTENFVTFMLADKGYYDYDYKEPSEDWVIIQESANSDEELAARLAKMGLKPRTQKPMTAEEMQRIAMEENR